MKKLLCLLFLVPQLCFSQASVVSETIRKIEFSEDTIKSVYDWVAGNIKYDVKKMKENEERGRSRKKSGFKSEEEYHNHLLKLVVKNKKGVCEDYSLLFDAIVKELGYESYIIEGYTKNKKGKLSKRIGHAWNAVRIDDSWKLFDLTWGAGYVEDEKRFVRKYNQEWYDTRPEEMIKTHMPYDPIWQLSENPVSYENFEKNTPVSDSGVKYDYMKLIDEYLVKERKDQLQDQVDRSRALGEGIRLIEKWRRNLTKNIGHYGVKDQYQLLNEATENSKRAVELLNKYIDCRNQRFEGKCSADVARQYLEDARFDAQSASEVYESAEVSGRTATSNLSKSKKHIRSLLDTIDEQLKYLATFQN